MAIAIEENHNSVHTQTWKNRLTAPFIRIVVEKESSAVMLVLVFFALAAYDVWNKWCRFETILSIVKNWKTSQKSTDSSATERLCCVVNRACIWYPKRVQCLQRSVVTACLLRTIGVPARLVVGVQKLPFRAHAWVEVGEIVINESSDVRSTYSILERC
jgi:hypothetical protein